MRRFWAFICMVMTMLVVVIFNSQAVLQSTNQSLEYKGGREAVFSLTQRDEGITLSESDISAKISKRLDIAGASNSKVEIDRSSNEEYQVRVALSTKTSAEFENIIRVIKANNVLTVSAATDDEVTGEEFFSSDAIMTLNYEGVSPIPVFNIKNSTVFDQLKDKASKHENEELQKTLYVWENKTEEDTYDKAFGEENGRDDVKKKIIATLNVDDFNSETNEIRVSKDENGNEFIISSARSYVNARNAEDLGFDIEYLYDNYIDEAYPSYALTLSYIGIGVQILLLAISLILMYGYSGIVSSVSILVGSLIQVLIFSFLGFEFTPVTIAAVSLTMILAAFVQYNYFERIKSELKKGRGIAKSNSEGYRKSFVVTLDSSAVVFIASLFAFIFGKGMIRPFAGVSLIGSLVVFLIVNYLSKWMMYWMVTAPYFNKKENTFGIKAISDKEVKKLNEKIFVSKNSYKKKASISFASLGGSILVLAVSVLALVFSSGANNLLNRSGDYGVTYRVDAQFVTLRTVAEDATVNGISEFVEKIKEGNDTLKDIDDIIVDSTFNKFETVDDKYVDTYTTYISLKLSRQLTNEEFDVLKTQVESFDFAQAYASDIKVMNSVGKNGEIVHNNNNMFLVLGLTIVFSSLYFFVRYGLSSFLSTLTTSSIVTSLTVALLILTRLPINSTSLFGILVALIILNALFVSVFARNKELIKDQKIVHATSDQRLEVLNSSIQFSLTPVIYASIAFVLVFVALALFGTINALVLGISGIVFLALGIIAYFYVLPNTFFFFKMLFNYDMRDTIKKNRNLHKKKIVVDENEPMETIVPGIND